MLIDTHCHLQILQERGLLNAALEGAQAAGVDRIICVGLNLEDSERCRNIAEANRGVYFTVGWHPHEKLPPDEKQLKALSELLSHEKAVAVGEVGLDLYFRPGYHETSLQIQRRSLDAMFELALQHDKPVIIHDRDAHDEVLETLDRHEGARGVMHCFSGDAVFGEACVARGFMLSFSGIVTFPKSDGIQAAAKTVRADQYVVETDSPFLAPVPQRGRTCLPEYVAATARKVAELRGAVFEDVCRETTENAGRLFGLTR